MNSRVGIWIYGSNTWPKFSPTRTSLPVTPGSTASQCFQGCPQPAAIQGMSPTHPLPLHLMAATMVSLSSLGAWSHLRNGWRPSSVKSEEDRIALQRDLAAADPETFRSALEQELSSRHLAFLDGLEAFRARARDPRPQRPPVLWKTGTTSLLDYGAPGDCKGRPVLVIPSLINRSYILDLTRKVSLMRYLSGRGMRPLLVDWGTPGPGDLNLSLDDYIGRRLVDALDVACSVSGERRVPVIGYCMGGTLAVALADLVGERISALVALAAPWDFHAPHNGPSSRLAAFSPLLEAFIAANGCLSAELLQSTFFWIDPTQSWHKFRRFAEVSQNSREAELFVAVEDWVNDGVPLAGPVAQTCLAGWYMNNEPAAGRWRVAGETINPARIRVPALVVVPARDRIVPPKSAAPLADRIPKARRMTPRTGHIGMIVGSRMTDRLWRPLLNWLRDQD